MAEILVTSHVFNPLMHVLLNDIRCQSSYVVYVQDPEVASCKKAWQTATVIAWRKQAPCVSNTQNGDTITWHLRKNYTNPNTIFHRLQNQNIGIWGKTTYLILPCEYSIFICKIKILDNSKYTEYS